MVLSSLYARFDFSSGNETARELLAELKRYIRTIVCTEVPSYFSNAREYRCLIIANDSNVVFVGILDVVKELKENSWRVVEEDEDVINENVLSLLTNMLKDDNVAMIVDVYEEYINEYGEEGRYLKVKYIKTDMRVGGEAVIIIDPVAYVYPPTGLLRTLMKYGRLDFRILRSM